MGLDDRPAPDGVGVPKTGRLLTTGELVGAAILAAFMVGLALGGGTGLLTVPKAVLLGAVEGVTEYLPVSSTGHLLVTQRLIGLGAGAGKTAADTYAVAIQVGAIAAVLALYRTRIRTMVQGILGHDQVGRRLVGRLVVAFLPAAAVGVVFQTTIKDRLFGPWPIVVAWAAGGVFLLWWGQTHGDRELEALTTRGAILIGVAQVAAMWPGVSRSLVSIVAALAVGLTLAAALEFSFLLGLATLLAATVWDLGNNGATLLADYGWRTPLLGALVAFVTAYAAVRWMVGYLRTRPLGNFGWYRIGIAVVTVILLAVGALS